MSFALKEEYDDIYSVKNEICREGLAYLRALVEHYPGKIEFSIGSGRIFYGLNKYLPSIPGLEEQKAALCHRIEQNIYPLAERFYAQAVEITLTISTDESRLRPPSVVGETEIFLALDAEVGALRHAVLPPYHALTDAATIAIACGMTVQARPVNIGYHKLHEDRGRGPWNATSNLPNRDSLNRYKDPLNPEPVWPPYKPYGSYDPPGPPELHAGEIRLPPETTGSGGAHGEPHHETLSARYEEESTSRETPRAAAKPAPAPRNARPEATHGPVTPAAIAAALAPLAAAIERGHPPEARVQPAGVHAAAPVITPAPVLIRMGTAPTAAPASARAHAEQPAAPQHAAELTHEPASEPVHNFAAEIHAEPALTLHTEPAAREELHFEPAHAETPEAEHEPEAHLETLEARAEPAEHLEDARREEPQERAEATEHPEPEQAHREEAPEERPEAPEERREARTEQEERPEPAHREQASEERPEAPEEKHEARTEQEEQPEPAHREKASEKRPEASEEKHDASAKQEERPEPAHKETADAREEPSARPEETASAEGHDARPEPAHRETAEARAEPEEHAQTEAAPTQRAEARAEPHVEHASTETAEAKTEATPHSAHTHAMVAKAEAAPEEQHAIKVADTEELDQRKVFTYALGHDVVPQTVAHPHPTSAEMQGTLHAAAYVHLLDVPTHHHVYDQLQTKKAPQPAPQQTAGIVLAKNAAPAPKLQIVASSAKPSVAPKPVKLMMPKPKPQARLTRTAFLKRLLQAEMVPVPGADEEA